MMRLLRQILCLNPFKGDVAVSRVWILRRSTRGEMVPFPNQKNYQQPLDILQTFFAKSDQQQGDARHNRYLEIPGLDPVLVTRDPAMIRAILTATGERVDQFDRDTMPSTGIARATGADTLLFANGPQWRSHRKASSKAFGKTALFQPEIFAEFEQTFRNHAIESVETLRARLSASGEAEVEMELEPEIKTIMMELLVNNFFGAEVDRDVIRKVYVPTVDRIIQHIVRDTIVNRFQWRWFKSKNQNRATEELEADFRRFEELTDLAIEPRQSKRGAWCRVDPTISDDDLRSNVRVFLAGAVEATSSLAMWTISHLARNPDIRDRVFQELDPINQFTTDVLKRAPTFANTIRETLRLTPSLYFLPRQATSDTWVEVADQRKICIPAGTHLLLDVWHCNRLEEFWGVEKTGYPAGEFHPDRWKNIDVKRKSKEFLHFGFGHGARTCPGKHLGELETSLVVGGIVKLFDFNAVNDQVNAQAGVSTKPADRVLVKLKPRC